MLVESPPGGIEPYKSPGHEQDFMNSVRTRKKPIMTIEAGHAWFESGREPVYARAAPDRPTTFVSAALCSCRHRF